MTTTTTTTTTMTNQKQLISIKNLSITYKSNYGKTISLLRDVNFNVFENEVRGIVGESGSGKSLTNLSLMGLLSEKLSATADELLFQEHNLLLTKNASAWNKIRGPLISMIFQDPMTALNPSFRVSELFLSVFKNHERTLKEKLKLTQTPTRALLLSYAASLLQEVGLSESERILNLYPFEMSGGMAQRVMIAMALSLRPKLLIADEPTTALDVTIQAQILNLIKKLQRDHEMSVILVSHDLGVISSMSDRIAVMYAGEIVEDDSRENIIHTPKHPYTKLLLKSRPPMDGPIPEKLPTIDGKLPSVEARPSGCQFAPRCPNTNDKIKCHSERPNMHQNVRCFFPNTVSTVSQQQGNIP